MVHSNNDTPQVSMVKNADGLAVWFDRPQNKYDTMPANFQLVQRNPSTVRPAEFVTKIPGDFATN